MTMNEGCKDKWSDVASFSFDGQDTASEMFMLSMKAPALTLFIPGTDCQSLNWLFYHSLSKSCSSDFK